MTRARILDPYTRRVDDTRHKMSRVALVGGLILLAMLMGFVIAILPMSFMIIPMSPILVLAALALWVAPDVGTDLDGAIRKLFLLFFAVIMVWPDYIALTMPGIGWMSPQRLIMGLLFFTTLYALATSSETRRRIFEIISHVKLTYWLILSFFILQIMFAVATNSISGRFIYSQIFWYYMFVMAAWAISTEKTAFRLFQIIIIGAAVQCFYGAAEMYFERPAWAPYVPTWLWGDPELVAKIMGYEGRAGMQRYRVGSIYNTSLTYGEAIGLFVPFVMFAIFFARTALWRIAAGALLMFLFVNAIFTGARGAMIGFIIGTVVMVGLWAIQRYRKLKAERDIVAPSVLFAYPAGLFVLMLAVLFIRRVRVAVIGGGEHEASNRGREEMWEKTFDYLQQNPFGYGPYSATNMVGNVLGDGSITIDGYYINLLLDFGILGFLLFMAFFISCIFIGIKTFLNSKNIDESLGAPFAVALFSFLVIKSVLSQTENHHIAFALAGGVLAIHWRQSQRIRRDVATRQPTDAAATEAPLPQKPPLSGPVGGYGVAVSR